MLTYDFQYAALTAPRTESSRVNFKRTLQGICTFVFAKWDKQKLQFSFKPGETKYSGFTTNYFQFPCRFKGI